MAFAELWLPIIGAGIYIAWAIGAWYGGDKKLAIWLIFFGVVSLLFLGALQWQHAIISAPEDDLQRREQNELRRANIALKNILGEPIPLPDGRLGGWNFVFNLENIGPTATRTIKMATNACVFDGPITEDFAFEKPPPDLPVQSAETSPIGPHTPMHIRGNYSPLST
jgi:hypothetical protein